MTRGWSWVGTAIGGLVLSCSIGAAVVAAPMLARTPAAAAAEPGDLASRVEPLPPGAIHRIPGGLARATEACRLGMAGAWSGNTLNYIYDDDQFYTLLQVSDCLDCAGADSVSVSRAHVVLYFPVACQMPVSVYLVGAVSDQGCASFPDYSGPPLSTPVIDTLRADVDGTLANFEIPITPVVIRERVFLCIDFITVGAACRDYTLRPRLLLVDAACQPCRQFNDYSDLNGAIPEDLCDPFDPIPNLVMYVDVDSCFVSGPTPAKSETIGSIKVRYR